MRPGYGTLRVGARQSSYRAIGKLYGYGDSIMDGTGGQPSWFERLQAVYSPTVLEAVSGSGLYGDSGAGNQATIDAYIASVITPDAPDTLWDAKGINDSGDNGSVWAGVGGASAFGTAKGLFWDRLKAALPNLFIYASTMPAGYITGFQYDNNSSTGGLGQHRQAIRDAAASRTSFVQLVEWASVLDPATDLEDQVHPNPAGQIKLFNSARAILGV